MLWYVGRFLGRKHKEKISQYARSSDFTLIALQLPRIPYVAVNELAKRTLVAGSPSGADRPPRPRRPAGCDRRLSKPAAALLYISAACCTASGTEAGEVASWDVSDAVSQCGADRQSITTGTVRRRTTATSELLVIFRRGATVPSRTADVSATDLRTAVLSSACAVGCAPQTYHHCKRRVDGTSNCRRLLRFR